MKPLFTIYALLFFATSMNCQNKVLYLYVDDTMFSYCCEKQLCFGFSIPSKDKNFITDYYSFEIPNLKGFDDNDCYEYYRYDEIRQSKALEKEQLVTVHELAKDRSPWELHNLLSNQSLKIFLVEDSRQENKRNMYFLYPMNYVGTRKNVIVTDNSLD